MVTLMKPKLLYPCGAGGRNRRSAQSMAWTQQRGDDYVNTYQERQNARLADILLVQKKPEKKVR